MELFLAARMLAKYWYLGWSSFFLFLSHDLPQFLHTTLLVRPVEQLCLVQGALPAVPLRVVPDPLVAYPLVPQEDGAGGVLREVVGAVAAPQVVPPDGRALLREHGDAGVGPHGGPALKKNNQIKK